MRGATRRSASVLIAFALTVSLMLSVINIIRVNAQGNGFRISPVTSEFVIEKGKSQVLNITIENPTEVATTAEAVINDFVASDKEDGEVRPILDETVGQAPKNSFKNLVKKPENVVLGPKEKKEVPVTIIVPEDASAGGYYGVVRFVPTSINNQGNVALTASVGTIVLVRVPGDLKERLDLVQLTAAQGGKPKSFFTGGDVDIVTRLKNNGDIHLKPIGKIAIKNMFGKVVHEFEMNKGDQLANILPDSTRRFAESIPNKKWFGRYTIEANLAFQSGSGELISAKSTFWYIPIWAILIILALVALLVAGVMFSARKFKAKRLQHKPAAKRKK